MMDIYFAADGLVDYFDKLEESYRRQIDEVTALEEQTHYEENLTRQLEAELPNLRSKMEGIFVDLNAEVDKNREYVQAMDAFEMRMDEESQQVGLRVLKRLNAPIPEWYTHSINDVDDQALDKMAEALKHPIYTRDHDASRRLQGKYWEENCNSYSGRCHRDKPIPPSLEPENPGFVKSLPPDLEEDTREKLDQTSLLRQLSDLHDLVSDYAGHNPSDAQNSANRVWTRLRAVGSDYSKAIQLKRAHTFLSETRNSAVEKLSRDAFWWYLDHLTQVVATKSWWTSTAEYQSRFQKVQQEVIKFARGEFDLTQQSVTALTSGDPHEIQRIQNLMSEKLCDFRASVDKEIFPLPEKFSFLFPSKPNCKD